MPVSYFISQILNGAGPLIGLAICGWTVVAVTRAWRGKTIVNAPSPELLQPTEQRLERLEQATEAIALEVERIAEGQRFVTKLLSASEHERARMASAL